MHCKVREILEVLKIFCPGCSKPFKYFDMWKHLHTNECGNITEEMKLSEDQMQESINFNLQKVYGLQPAKKTSFPNEIFILDKDKLKLYMYSRLTNTYQEHNLGYEPAEGGKVPISKQSNAPALPHNNNYVQFGQPPQLIMVGGGSFENIELDTHKQTRKLVHNKGKFKLELLQSCKYARNGHAITSLNNTQVIVTGTRIGNGATCESFDVRANKWTDLPMLNNGRYYHSSCSFNQSKVFVFCGLCATSKKYLESIEMLDVGARANEWINFEIKFKPEQTYMIMSGRQGLGSCQYDDKSILVLGGYSQGVFNDESFFINVEEQTIEKGPTMPIETFPFAMPTLCDVSNQIAYTIDWTKYKMLELKKDKWSQIASFKGY